jgi:2-oxoglutarate ferredoxin oxidoreductase subunit alpha
MGHGDTQSIMLLPGSVCECFEFGWRALDIAEQLQTPVIVLSDLDIGMNQWVTEPFAYPDTPINRGKILWEADLEKWHGKWGRYLDIDQDGVPYRTVPGNTHPLSAYFARGTGHDEFAGYSESNQEYEHNMARLKKKHETAREYMPKPIIHTMEGATVGIIGFGSTDSAIQEARYLLAEEGLKTNYLRLRAIPLTSEVYDFIGSNERIYVVEMNRDGQLHQLLSLEYINTCAKLISIAHLDGLPMTAKWVVDEIKGKEGR